MERSLVLAPFQLLCSSCVIYKARRGAGPQGVRQYWKHCAAEPCHSLTSLRALTVPKGASHGRVDVQDFPQSRQRAGLGSA